MSIPVLNCISRTNIKCLFYLLPKLSSFLNLIITLGINSQIESKAVKAHMLLCKHSFPLNPVSRHHATDDLLA